jgi:23S rRNA (guanosine2251-2'-O)-methyltransferase
MRALYGIHPVRELVRAGAEGLSELWVAEGLRGREIDDLERMARQAGAKVHSAPRTRLDRLAGTHRHQGVVAVVADYRYRDLEELLSQPRARGEPPLLVVLDGVEDPQNLGAVIRSAHALGAHGVVIARDRAAGITAAVAKASAGAIEHCPVARVTNIAQAIESLKESGLWSTAMAADGDRTIDAVDLSGPSALIIGNEGEGIRPLVKRTCDYIARIEMAGKLGSLNAAVSASIALYEAMRQRLRTGGSPARGGDGESEGESRP